MNLKQKDGIRFIKTQMKVFQFLSARWRKVKFLDLGETTFFSLKNLHYIFYYSRVEFIVGFLVVDSTRQLCFVF